MRAGRERDTLWVGRRKAKGKRMKRYFRKKHIRQEKEYISKQGAFLKKTQRFRGLTKRKTTTTYKLWDR